MTSLNEPTTFNSLPGTTLDVKNLSIPSTRKIVRKHKKHNIIKLTNFSLNSASNNMLVYYFIIIDVLMTRGSNFGIVTSPQTYS